MRRVSAFTDKDDVHNYSKLLIDVSSSSAEGEVDKKSFISTLGPLCSWKRVLGTNVDASDRSSSILGFICT